MNMEKSEQIKAGLRRSFQTGESAKASTVCYGYKVTTEGKLVAYPSEAIIVFHIFERFAAGDSLWTRETISKILSNEKYVGDVIFGKTQVQNGVQVKTVDRASQTVMNGNHEAIISRELFDIVQQKKTRRCRVKNHFHTA